MNKAKNNQDNLVEAIMASLEAMRGVSTVEYEGSIGLYKNEVVFGKIDATKVFLLNHKNDFVEVSQDLVQKLLQRRKEPFDVDMLLYRATEAYWYADNKRKMDRKLSVVKVAAEN